MVSAFQGILGTLWGHFLGGLQVWLGQAWKEFTMMDSLAVKGKGWHGFFLSREWPWGLSSKQGPTGDGLSEMGRTLRGSSWARGRLGCRRSHDPGERAVSRDTAQGLGGSWLAACGAAGVARGGWGLEGDQRGGRG